MRRVVFRDIHDDATVSGTYIELFSIPPIAVEIYHQPAVRCAAVNCAAHPTQYDAAVQSTEINSTANVCDRNPSIVCLERNIRAFRNKDLVTNVPLCVFPSSRTLGE